MGCSSCSVSKDGGGGCSTTGGCNNGCSTGGCNRLNTFDWLAKLDIQDTNHFDIIEVSFKNGARKEFYRNPAFTKTQTGDMVVIETESGYDIGRISLSGDLVRLQIRKKRVKENSIFKQVIRKANERDVERLNEARADEIPTMIKARTIARALDLDMKIGDVEYQGDKRKATFYYTADGRVDFRELIRHYAKEFKVKIEMRQIGARQESARIGGLGSCGRELCCSTWLTDFQSVSTTAARYQNLAINQSKLSGQCGRLKCCLNYELDIYLDALEDFPMEADTLETNAGRASLVKTDIFKKLMFYTYNSDRSNKFYALDTESVQEILELNQKGVKVESLSEFEIDADDTDENDFQDVTGAVELPEEIRKKKKRKKKNRTGGDAEGTSQRGGAPNKPKQQKPPPPPPILNDLKLVGEPNIGSKPVEGTKQNNNNNNRNNQKGGNPQQQRPQQQQGQEQPRQEKEISMPRIEPKLPIINKPSNNAENQQPTPPSAANEQPNGNGNNENPNNKKNNNFKKNRNFNRNKNRDKGDGNNNPPPPSE